MTFADVVQQNVPIYEEWVAQLNGPVNADITPKVQGYLLKQNYQNGFFVKKGQLLYEIDPRPFVAALDQAKAQVAVAKPIGRSTEQRHPRYAACSTERHPAESNWTPIIALRRRPGPTRAAQAQQEQAELNLEWTKVYSPIDGVAGVSNSQVGDLVGTPTKMTTISQVDPIWAYFNISESDYLGRAQMISGIVSGEKRKISRHLPVEYHPGQWRTFPAESNIVRSIARSPPGPAPSSLPRHFQIRAAFFAPAASARCGFRPGSIANALLIPQPP